MSDVDQMLDRLRGATVDPRLEGIEAAVFAGVAVGRERAMRRSLVVTSLLALGVGLVASMASPQQAQAEQTVVLNTIPSNAPSSLLLGEH